MLDSQQCPTAHKVPRKRPYICNACFKQFETPSKLSRHYLIHTGHKPFQCHTCPKTFRQLVHLERHQQTHSLPFQCGICHRSFKNLVTFLKHQQLHSESVRSRMKPPKKLAFASQERPACGPFHCAVCMKSFTTEDRWVLHQCTAPLAPPPSLARRPKVQKCDFCLKPFPSRSKLERHILIHTGQRPFACLLCGKTFRQKTHLKIHQITHMEEKPFECGFCRKRFKVQSKLFKHRQVHIRKALNPKVVRRGRRARAAAIPIVIDDETFEEGGVDKPFSRNTSEICSVYVIPFQCPGCEQSFETQQILETHTCFIAEDGKVMNTGKINLTHRSRGRRGRLSMQLKLAGDRQVEFPLFTRKKRNCHFVDQQQLVLEEPSGTDDNAAAKRPTSVRKMVSHKMVCPKRNIFKHQSGQKEWPKPFSFPKHVQSHKLGIDMNNTLPVGSLLDEQNFGGREDAIYVSSGEECDTTEVHQKAFHGRRRRMRSRYKITSKCDMCEKIFPSLSKLRRHYLVHTGQKPFACAVCGKTFRQSAHLKRHQTTHTQKGLPLETLGSKAEFRDVNHHFSHPAEPVELRSGFPLGSSLRPSPDFDEYDLTYSEPIAEIKEAVEADAAFEVNADDVHTFEYDGHFFQDKKDQSGGPWNDSPAGMERNTGTRRSYQCSVCFKLFKSPSKLERHFLVHAGQKPFECSLCGKTFRQVPHLKRHLVTHSKEQL